MTSEKVRPIVATDFLPQYRSGIHQSFSYMFGNLFGIPIAYSVEHLVVENAVDLSVVYLVIPFFLHIQEADVKWNLRRGHHSFAMVAHGMACCGKCFGFKRPFF